MPYAEQSIKYWSALWDNPVYHNINAYWIMTVEKELECVVQQGNINITNQDISIRLTKMPNCKTRDPDELLRFWLKICTSLNQALIDDRIQTRYVPNWMVESRACTERCKKWECCLQLQTNSLLESPLEITDSYY